MPITINLDEAVPEDIRFIIGGETYLLPADIPIPVYVELDRLMSSDEDEDTERVVLLYEKVLEILRIRQPRLESVPIGPRRLGAALASIYGHYSDVDGGEGDAPDPPSTPSTGD